MVYNINNYYGKKKNIYKTGRKDRITVVVGAIIYMYTCQNVHGSTDQWMYLWASERPQVFGY